MLKPIKVKRNHHPYSEITFCKGQSGVILAAKGSSVAENALSLNTEYFGKDTRYFCFTGQNKVRVRREIGLGPTTRAGPEPFMSRLCDLKL